MNKKSDTKEPVEINKILKSLHRNTLFIEVEAPTDNLAVTAITDIGGELSNLHKGMELFYAEGVIKDCGIIQVEQLKRKGWHW